MIQLQDLYEYGFFIDTGAEGHYASVVEVEVKNSNQGYSTGAFKMMRDDHVCIASKKDFEWNAFKTEIRALSKLHDKPGVVNFFDCGYINASINGRKDEPMPTDEIVSMGVDKDQFINCMEDYRTKNWRPYIVLELLPRDNSLEFIVGHGGNGKRYPTKTSLLILSEFVNMLLWLGENGILYLDHKLAHVYWDNTNHELTITDWNACEFFDENTHDAEKLKWQDVLDMIIVILPALLSGKPSIKTRGPRPKDGWVQNQLGDWHNYQLPDDIAARSIFQKLVNDLLTRKIKDIPALRQELDKVMVLYGIEHEVKPSPDNKNGQKIVEAHLKELIHHKKALSQLMEKIIADARNNGIPSHFQQELVTIANGISAMLAGITMNVD